MKYLRLAFRNVFRKKTRAFLTIASVVLVVVLIVVLSSLLASLQGDAGPITGATRIFVQHTAGLAQFLPLSYRHKMEALPGVVAVSEMAWFGGTYIDERPQHVFAQMACDAQAWPKIHDDFALQRAQLREFQSRRDSFIAGRQIVGRFKWRIGDRIQLKGSYLPIVLDLVLVGVYSGPDESVIYFHFKQLERSWLAAAGMTQYFMVRVNSTEDVSPTVDRINAMFENSSAPVRALPEKQFKIEFMGMLGNVKLLVRSISLVVLFTIVLIVANTMAMGARERAKEVAVIRALGFKRHHVLGLILGEALILALAGGCAGVLLSFPAVSLIVEAMKQSPAAAFAYNFRVSAETITMAFAAAVSIGTVAGFVPAVRAARIPIVETLRQVA